MRERERVLEGETLELRRARPGATSAELVERFEETMSAVAREAPTLRASHASLVRLESEAADVKKALDAVCASRARGALDAKQYRKQRASLQKEMRELAQEAHRAYFRIQTAYVRPRDRANFGERGRERERLVLVLVVRARAP